MRAVIAYPGVEGSFSYGAARSAFPDAQWKGYDTFEDAARSVLEGEARYAVLPIENSSAGAVLTTYSILEKEPLWIVGECTQPVRHQLLGIPGSQLAGIRTITSHPQAISQCAAFLSSLQGVQIVPSGNTALSAREVANRGDPAWAAIASEEAARIFGLSVIAEDIHTSKHNTTRFMILSRYPIPLETPNKASVIFTVDNTVGALVRVLDSFARSGLNMTRIESRPIPDTPFLYFFSGDFEGAMDKDHLEEAMDNARPFTTQLRLLGIYAKANMTDE
ncbi:MAG: prephenate dehydratase [Clostridia bacterium]|nr:prephenate dehydratase [Clostridia bacterium]